jgi:hypothetical protein
MEYSPGEKNFHWSRKEQDLDELEQRASFFCSGIAAMAEESLAITGCH